MLNRRFTLLIAVLLLAALTLWLSFELAYSDNSIYVPVTTSPDLCVATDRDYDRAFPCTWERVDVGTVEGLDPYIREYLTQSSILYVYVNIDGYGIVTAIVADDDSNEVTSVLIGQGLTVAEAVEGVARGRALP